MIVSKDLLEKMDSADHFKKEILEREKDFIMNGGELLFPLPEISLINKKNYAKNLSN